jgi:arsenate reductase
MKKVYHLSTCDTSQAIIKENKLDKKGFELQDIKTEKITEAQLDEMKKMAGSYEALFSRRAIKYKSLGLGLKDMNLSEKDYRKYILEEYTFLKRPVIINENEIFIGSEKKNLEALKKSIR